MLRFVDVFTDPFVLMRRSVIVPRGALCIVLCYVFRCLPPWKS